MTYRELLKKRNPDLILEELAVIVEEECPHHYYRRAHLPVWCCGGVKREDCVKCWEREVPEEVLMDTVEKTVETIVEELAAPMPGKEPTEPTILDSGDRTEFESGAVRDMRVGKGRCDLIPLEVMREMMNDQIIGYITNFMQDYDTSELYNCLEGFADEAYGGCLPTMFLEVAKHYEEGAKKYGPDNWQKGIPVYCYIDSALRHYLKWLRKDNDEFHNRAFVWNLLCCIWEVDYHRETSE